MHWSHGLQHLRHKRPTRRNRGLPSLGHSAALCCQRNSFCSAALLYTYISRFSVTPHYISRGRKSGKATAINFIHQPLFNFLHKRPTFAFTSESGYTLGFQRKIAHSGLHAETGAFPPSSTARPCTASEIATERTARGSGCTPMACVRFLRHRSPAGLRNILFGLLMLYFSRSAHGDFCVCEVKAVSLPSAYSVCRRNARCPLVKAANSPFPCLARFFFDSSSAKYCPLSLQMPKGPAGYPLVLSLLFASPYLP